MGITITETPKIKYVESSSDPTLIGNGAEIPVIIGLSGNASPKTGVQKFESYEDCEKSVANGGIGTDTSTNPLLAFLKRFFKENKKKNTGDLKVPYVYVIDIGKAKITETSAWLNAFELAKVKREAQVEIYVGFQSSDSQENVIALLQSAIACIDEDSLYGAPRIAYFSIDGITDANLKKYTSDTEDHYIRDSRLVPLKHDFFPEYAARICNTPYYKEPGYYEMRSVNVGEFTEYTRNEANSLQNAGITFGMDEKIGSDILPRINMAVSSAFAANPDMRPNDSWLHARRNVDNLIRNAFNIMEPQLKENETEINLSYLQSDLDVYVNNEINNGYMMDGTSLTVKESTVDPVDLIIEGVAIPVNSSLIIEFTMYVKDPNTTVNGGN